MAVFSSGNEGSGRTDDEDSHIAELSDVCNDLGVKIDEYIGFDPKRTPPKWAA